MKSNLTILLFAFIYSYVIAQEKRTFKIYVLGDHLEVNKPEIVLNNHHYLTNSSLDSLEFLKVEMTYGKNILEFKYPGYYYGDFVDTLEINEKTPECIYYLNGNFLRTCEAIEITESEIKDYKKNKRKLRRLKRLAFLKKILLIEISNFKIQIQ